MQERDLWTVPEVADYLRCSEEAVRRWLRSGRLHGTNLGGAGGWRIAHEDLMAMLRKIRGEAP